MTAHCLLDIHGWQQFSRPRDCVNAQVRRTSRARRHRMISRPLQAHFSRSVPVSALMLERLNSAGTGLIYSTYFGGLAARDHGQRNCCVDGAGSAYIVGAGDIPTRNPIETHWYIGFCGEIYSRLEAILFTQTTWAVRRSILRSELR